MGRMLEALKQIEDQAPSSRPAKPIAPEERAAVEEASAADHPVAAVEPDQPPPLDPRYREVLGAILSRVAVRNDAVVLIAGFAGDEPRGGQLATLYPLLGGRIDGGILAVDADVHHAGLTERFDLRGEHGLADLLVRRAAWRNVVRETRHPGLHLLPGKRCPEPFSPSDLSPLLAEWRDAYRLVLLDTLLSTPREIADWSAVCDAVVLAVRLEATPRREVRKTLRAIRARGGDVLGCVLLEP